MSLTILKTSEAICFILLTCKGVFVEVNRACRDDVKSLLMKRKALSWILSNLFVLEVLQNATLAGNN